MMENGGHLRLKINSIVSQVGIKTALEISGGKFMLVSQLWKLRNLGSVLCALLCFILLPVTSLALQSKADSMSDATHFEFQGSNAWDYSFDNTDQGFVLLLKSLNPEAEKLLTEFRDERVQSIEITRVPGDYPIQVTFKFASKNLEAFDYLTDDPKRLVVDIFNSKNTASSLSTASTPSPSRAPAGEMPIKVDAATLPTNVPPLASAANALTPVEVLGLFDAADPTYNRFKVNPDEVNPKSIVTESRRLFLELPAWERPHALLEDLLKDKPIYKIHEKPGQENLEARFLLQLFLKEHPAGTIKAAEIFLRKHPKSDYRQIVEHILADTYFQTWLDSDNKGAFERAMGLYKDLVRKNPNSPLQERTELVMGLGYLKRGDAPSAARVLEKFKDNFPMSSYLPQVELALTHTDLLLNSYDKALGRLKGLVEAEDTPAPVREEAVHLRGNVFLQQKKWNDAIQAYLAARESHPDAVKFLGYATFNLGESYFWNEEYLKSLDAFREYATYFPETAHTAYALTRMGEIFEILGQPESRSLAIYRESHFRFRDTDGGRLARVRFISRTMKEMNDKDIIAALKEIAEISHKMSHPQFGDFIELVKADGYSLRGDYAKAAEMLMAHLAVNPRTEHRKKYEEAIASNLALQMRKELVSGNPIESLRIYSKNSQLWFNKADRLDPLYLASWAYEKAGAPEKALSLYKEYESKLSQIPNGEDKAEKMVIENLPAHEILWLRMAATTCGMNQYTECGNFLKKIGDPENLSDREYVELALLAATLLENSGKSSEVAKVLDSVEKRREALNDPQTLLQLARAYSKIKRAEKAAQYYNDFITLSKDVTIEAKQVVLVHTELADLYLKNKQKSKAKETLERVIEAYGSGYDLSPERYNLGLLYLEDGNKQAAQQVWQPLLGLQNNFWSKMAEDKIQDLKWREEYGSVLNRLPASRSNN